MTRAPEQLAPAGEEQPARPEEREETVLGPEERWENEARRVALEQGSPLPPGADNKPRLIEFLKHYDELVQTAAGYFRGLSDEELVVSSAAEWILDNQYVVRQALRQVREDLPAKYYDELQRLPSAGPPGRAPRSLPRAYLLARELVVLQNGILDLARVRQFIRTYQGATALRMGELWSLPAFLRLGIIQALSGALLEILARKTTGTAALAELQAEAVQPSGEDDTVARLKSLPADLPLIDLSDAIDPDEIVARGIISLRNLANEDWKDFFEDLSLVDAVLREDPAGLYAGMDFETRDRYRKVVERLAIDSGCTETEISALAVELARSDLERNGSGALIFPRPQGGDNWDGFTSRAASHVGYYLLGEGLVELEAAAGYRPQGIKGWRRWIETHPEAVYLGSIGLVTGLAGLLVGRAAWAAGGGAWGAVLAGVLFLVPALRIAVHLVNWAVTRLVEPHRLPKMDFSAGLPVECHSLVAVPAMITSPEEVESLIQQLELHFLRNQDPNLRFALVTDFPDASQEHLETDEALLEQIRAGIQRLNARYAPRSERPFFLFHRARRWNPAEGVWMGWERKRGKLHELNCWLRGDRDTSFVVVDGALEELVDVRYVITLDADTILPAGGAQRLVATLAHPLNRAVFEPNRDGVPGERVRSGYTVLQPRTEISPTSATRTLFSRIYTGDAGLDLYTLAISDVYQDLFGEGIYTGKGIYDLDAFERSLEGVAPENALLSHDLFEGIHGRAGLVTDISLVEDFPAYYLVFTSRMHRWIRGDWQLLPWLLPSTPHGEGSLQPNRLSPVSRWKIADNLLRSLLAPAVLLFLLVGWTVLPGPAWAWTLVGLLPLGMPVLTSLLEGVIALAGAVSLRLAFRSAGKALVRTLLSLAFLPYETWDALDAIVVTLDRLGRKTGLLKWTTAAEATRQWIRNANAREVWRQMVPAVLASLGLTFVVSAMNPAALPEAAPLLLAWLVSPAIAYGISRPLQTGAAPLSEADLRSLRLLARRSWMFFERFVGPDDHWLPPDHFQESPKGVVAHRTSPTNIGLGLLSVLAAYDMGYTGVMSLAARLRSAMDSIQQLERYRGHLLNWFDTRSLAPLNPRYVSTVDSGNLAASLLALRQGILAVGQDPILRWQRWLGGLDGLDLLVDLLQDLPGKQAAAEAQPVIARLEQVKATILAGEKDSRTWPALIRMLRREVVPEMERKLGTLAQAHSEELGPEILYRLGVYARGLRQHLQNMQRTIDLLCPWLPYTESPPDLFTSPNLTGELAALHQALEAQLSVDVPIQDSGKTMQAARRTMEQMEAALEDLQGPDELVKDARNWCRNLARHLESAELASKSLLIGLEEIARQAERMVDEMDFRFLYSRRRQVFHIGYNLEVGRLDANYYDLIASEARITSLVAIAKGDVPVEHWLHLARPLGQVGDSPVLLSWSATMFEYLMPPLLLRSYDGTLLNQAEHAAADAQIEYMRAKNLPWGVSESGYFRFDSNLNYQYRAFGVPGLGYKRGLGDDLVVAPYASLLALSLRPAEVVKNYRDLAGFGMLGTYGLYEAIDFTPRRLPVGRRYEIVRSFMAHHQGMIVLALANYFTHGRMVERFHAEPRVRSVELLLQEMVPVSAPVETPHPENNTLNRPQQAVVIAQPWRMPVQTPQPRVHFLSNGRYGVLLNNTGGGYSTWGDTDLTRWRPDPTLNNWGTWIYVQDLESGEIWSAGEQPVASTASAQDVTFTAHKVDYYRRDGEITLVQEVTVPPEEDLEVRRITVTNQGDRPRRLRLVSYGEVILAPQKGDSRHPAFNKLFIESEWAAEQKTLVFRRRPRKSGEPPLFLGHTLVSTIPWNLDGRPSEKGNGAGEKVVLEGGQAPEMVAGQPEGVDYESSRLNFIGRGGTVHHPRALAERRPLSRTTGATLDPIFAIGQELELEPHASAQVSYLTIAGDSRQAVLDTAARFQMDHAVQRAFEQARARAEVELRRLGLESRELARMQNLLSLLVYPHPALRSDPELLRGNRLGQPGLWPYAISGDYPILLVKIENADQLSLVHDLLQAHIYWRSRGLMVDLVILNLRETGYSQELSGALHRLITRMDSDAWINRRGGIFIVAQEAMSEDEVVLLETVAQVVLTGERSLEEQLVALDQLPSQLPAFSGMPAEETDDQNPPLERPQDLLFDNGVGGFSPDGREYLIYLEGDRRPPAPWANVIANENFGFMTTEGGLGMTWAVNSGENRLTSWSNDPVSDPPGEVVYLRDEETAEVWTPTPLPAPGGAPYLVRHGAGYTRYEHQSHGLHQRLSVYLSPDEPVKVIHLRLENTTQRVRRITVTYYAEWVLGVSRDTSQLAIVPEYEPETQALLAFNEYNQEFAGRAAFAAANKGLHGLTADRGEFLGRNGSYRLPDALQRIGLAGTVLAGRDPCAALQLHVDLYPGEAEEVYFLLGQAEGREQSLELVRKYQQPGAVEAAWEATQEFWDRLLGTVQVHTPEPALDLMLNRWLPYQALSCRIWGRSAFYQSSGAYGFRDQLQDVMALVYAAPHLVREHILRAARHQFEAGDVLHWWHPPSGRGVRTRISDDLLWLPYVTAHYVEATGDIAILDEKVPWLGGKLLDPEEEERYSQYPVLNETSTLYEHCRRAIEKGLTAGPHKLPLIGTGDWNDGMNRVGAGGRGESVWLAWFLCDTLESFAGLCERRGDAEQAGYLRSRAAELGEAVEQNAWDGEWYRRAYYDDGSPLGSQRNRECKIDGIAQAWAVLSGAGDPQRSARAMESVYERLVRVEDRLVLLFTPPFDQTLRDPGYIKGYLPGIRENGGQYTHGAIWTVWAFARMGMGERALELFNLLNPVYHADTPGKVQRYAVEPYVVAADVYSMPPHTGRGGWTWYTGSSGWLYRLGLEAILGLRKVDGRLLVEPVIPEDWEGFTLEYRDGETRHTIRVENGHGGRRVTLDGRGLP